MCVPHPTITSDPVHTVLIVVEGTKITRKDLRGYFDNIDADWTKRLVDIPPDCLLSPEGGPASHKKPTQWGNTAVESGPVPPTTGWIRPDFMLNLVSQRQDPI